MPQLVLELTQAQADRICAAVGRLDGLMTVPDLKTDKDAVAQPRPATLEEVAARACGYLSSIVSDQETAVAVASAKDSVAELGIVAVSVKLA